MNREAKDYFSQMLLLLILFHICGIIRGIDIKIKRGFILEESNLKEIVKDHIYHANTLPIIELEIGNPKQKVRMVIDTFTLYSWIWNEDSDSINKYNSSLSSTYNQTTSAEMDIVFEYNLFKMKGSHASDVIWINNKLISQTSKYSFISCSPVLNNEKLNIDGYVSIAKSPNRNTITGSNRQSGLIQYLMNEGLVNNTIFSIYYTSDTSGVLKIGGIDSQIEEDRISYCNTKKENKSKEDSGNHSDLWECKLYLISFGSYVQSNNSTVLFGIGQEHIFAPIEHMRLIEVIKQEAEKYSSNCFLREKEKVIILRCEEFDLAQAHFQSLELQLKTYRIIIKPTDLFVWSEEEDDLLECVVHINKHISTWLLGDPGLKREYIIFDSMHDRIGFVDKEYVIDHLMPSFFNSIWLYFSVWCFFTIAGYYMIIQQRKQKKPMRKQNAFSTQFIN